MTEVFHSQKQKKKKNEFCRKCNKAAAMVYLYTLAVVMVTVQLNIIIIKQLKIKNDRFDLNFDQKLNVNSTKFLISFLIVLNYQISKTKISTFVN